MHRKMDEYHYITSACEQTRPDDPLQGTDDNTYERNVAVMFISTTILKLSEKKSFSRILKSKNEVFLELFLTPWGDYLWLLCCIQETVAYTIATSLPYMVDTTHDTVLLNLFLIYFKEAGKRQQENSKVNDIMCSIYSRLKSRTFTGQKTTKNNVSYHQTK